MILPSEVDRLRDLDASIADALIEACRNRPLILAKAQFGAFNPSTIGTAPTDIFSYRFSGAINGVPDVRKSDVLRGHVFGTFDSDTGGAPVLSTLELIVNGSVSASLAFNIADTATAKCALLIGFDVVYVGRAPDSNSVISSPDTYHLGQLRVKLGDTSIGPDTLSQYEDNANQYIGTSAGGININLTKPHSVALRLTLDGLEQTFTIYGGTLEGL